jgi:hypothetical protein
MVQVCLCASQEGLKMELCYKVSAGFSFRPSFSDLGRSVGRLFILSLN